jgi:hypothetical protein
MTTPIPQLIVNLPSPQLPWFGDGCGEVYPLTPAFETPGHAYSSQGNFLLLYYVEHLATNSQIPDAAYTQMFSIDANNNMSFVGSPHPVGNDGIAVHLNREAHGQYTSTSQSAQVGQAPLINCGRSRIARIRGAGSWNQVGSTLSTSYNPALYVQSLGDISGDYGVLSGSYAPAVTDDSGSQIYPNACAWITDRYLAVITARYGLILDAQTNTWVKNGTSNIWADLFSKVANTASIMPFAGEGGLGSSEIQVYTYVSGGNTPSGYVGWRINGTGNFTSTLELTGQTSADYRTNEIGRIQIGNTQANGMGYFSSTYTSGSTPYGIGYYSGSQSIGGNYPVDAGYTAGAQNENVCLQIAPLADGGKSYSISWQPFYTSATTVMTGGDAIPNGIEIRRFTLAQGTNPYTLTDDGVVGPYTLACPTAAQGGSGLIHVGVHVASDDQAWASACATSGLDANSYNQIAVCAVRVRVAVSGGWHMGSLGWGGTATA